jgi:hypothetical protein
VETPGPPVFGKEKVRRAKASLDFCPNPTTDLGFFIDDPTRIVTPKEHRDEGSELVFAQVMRTR